MKRKQENLQREKQINLLMRYQKENESEEYDDLEVSAFEFIFVACKNDLKIFQVISTYKKSIKS